MKLAPIIVLPLSSDALELIRNCSNNICRTADLIGNLQFVPNFCADNTQHQHGISDKSTLFEDL